MFSCNVVDVHYSPCLGSYAGDTYIYIFGKLPRPHHCRHHHHHVLDGLRVLWPWQVSLRQFPAMPPGGEADGVEWIQSMSRMTMSFQTDPDVAQDALLYASHRTSAPSFEHVIRIEKGGEELLTEERLLQKFPPLENPPWGFPHGGLPHGAIPHGDSPMGDSPMG